MSCTVDKRELAQQARRALVDHPDVLGAALSSPREDPTDRWTIECSLRQDSGGLDERACVAIAEHRLTVREVQPRGPSWRAVLTL